MQSDFANRFSLCLQMFSTNAKNISLCAIECKDQWVFNLKINLKSMISCLSFIVFFHYHSDKCYECLNPISCDEIITIFLYSN